MPALSPAELKRRRRVAARDLLSGPRGTRVTVDPGRKKHLVDGVWVDRLPFNAGEAWAAQRALEEVDRLEIEAAVLASEANEDILLAEPAQSDPEPDSCCARLLRRLPRSFRVRLDATCEFS